MTEWYYSDAQRTQHGPVTAADLAALHTKGVLTPDTLVWREGMSDWTPWRDMIREVISGNSPGDGSASAAAVATEAVIDDGAYRPYAVIEPSPYAPPESRVDESSHVTLGGRVVYAGFWKRYAAAVLDSFIVSAISYAILIPISLVMGVSMAGISSGADDPFGGGGGIALVGVMYLILLGMPAIYFAWMHSSSGQASLGKMAIGIKVVRTDGTRISFWRAFGRYFGYMLSTLMLYIGLIMAAFTDRKQALHDMISDTLVVDKHAYTDHPEWQREELGTITIVVIALSVLLIIGMIGLFAVLGLMLAGTLR